jgi:hypothetical protein
MTEEQRIAAAVQQASAQHQAQVGTFEYVGMRSVVFASNRVRTASTCRVGSRVCSTSTARITTLLDCRSYAFDSSFTHVSIAIEKKTLALYISRRLLLSQQVGRVPFCCDGGAYGRSDVSVGLLLLLFSFVSFIGVGCRNCGLSCRVTVAASPLDSQLGHINTTSGIVLSEPCFTRLTAS